MTFIRRWYAGLLTFWAEPLFKLIANSLTTAVVPTDWHLFFICPIHKKGDPEDVFNYHPLSLTTLVCNIFERILKRALLSFLSDTRSISPYQHGFLPRRSYLFNLLVFEEAVTRMIDEGHTVDVTYLHFVKVFDYDNRRLLLAKMKSFGLGDVVVRWIEAYLSGRVSRVQVGGEHSGQFQCTAVFRRAP